MIINLCVLQEFVEIINLTDVSEGTSVSLKA